MNQPEPPIGEPPADRTPVEDAPADSPGSAPADPSPPGEIADGVWRPIDPRWIPLDRLVGQIFVGVLGAGALGAAVFVLLLTRWPAWVWWLSAAGWAAVFPGLALLLWRLTPIEYRRTSYRVDAQGIEIRRGIWWRAVTSVPRSRVQHTDVSQGPFERRYGLGTLVIYTAGTDHARVDLPGLRHGLALRIRDHLLPRETVDAV